MDIGSLITKRLEDGGFKQSAIAAQFVERAKARGSERNFTTVETRLSKLKSADRTAVQFFFTDLRDAEDLMDLLGVHAGERGEVLNAANEVLDPEERPLRLVVDLTTASQDRAFIDACECVNRQLLEGAPPRIALVMTEAQREYLLPKFAPENRVQVAVVADPAAGEPTARSLAADAALVVSTWRHAPLSRWVAVRWPAPDGAAFTLEPSDAIEALRGGRPLPGEEPSVTGRDLQALAPNAVAAAPPKTYAPDAPALRRLIVSLQRGESVRPPVDPRRHSHEQAPVATPAERQSWAAHFAVTASATPEEWVEHLRAVAQDAGVSRIFRGREGLLRDEIIRVERGAATPRLVIEGTSVHLINPAPEGAERLRGLHGMTIHEVSPRESALHRLRTALATTTRQALLDDPLLERVVSALSREGGDLVELQYVAACFLANDAVKVDEAPRLQTWNASLRDLLDRDPPAAGLRVPRGEWRDDRSEPVRIALKMPRERAKGLASRPQIAGVPAAQCLRIDREECLVVGEPVERGYYGTETALPRGLALDDGLAVFEAFEKSTFRTGGQPIGDPWHARPVTFGADFWREADRHVATAWLALRRAARRADAVTLHDGTGILEMGAGIVAEVSAYAVPANERSQPCEADLALPTMPTPDSGSMREPGMKASAVVGALPTRSAHTGTLTTWAHALIPFGLYLAHGGVRIMVSFRSTPWDALLDVSTAGGVVAEEERRW